MSEYYYTEGDLSVLGQIELDSLVDLIECYRDGLWEAASEIIFNKLNPGKVTFGFNSNSGYVFIVTHEDHNAFVVRNDKYYLEWFVTCEGRNCSNEGFITDDEFSKLRKKIIKNYELPSRILCNDCLSHSKKDKK